MPTESDERMAKLKAAIDRYRDGDVSAGLGVEVTEADLVTISALAKATGDAFTFGLTQRLLTAMKMGKN
jgi:hypothetical protein